MKYCFVLILILASLLLKGQGCSDAGFCSVSGMNASEHLDTSKITNQKISFGLTNGIAQFNVYIGSPYVKYDIQVIEDLVLSAKLNYTFIIGKLTVVKGFSDLIVSTKYSVNKHFSLINGIKVPFNKSNLKYKGYEMPMSYQTTLGTVDYLFGMTYNKPKYFLGIGLQLPLVQNSNSFFAPSLIPFGLDSNYLSTNNYIRKSDLIIRVNYLPSLISEKLKLTVGILAIQHLANDKFTDVSGQQKDIKSSEGLTLNLNAISRFSVSKKSYIDFTLGVPVINRLARPDGLAQFALNLNYGINF